MDTAYSTAISIALHMAQCEGRATSENWLKARGMKAAAPHADGGHDHTDSY